MSLARRLLASFLCVPLLTAPTALGQEAHVADRELLHRAIQDELRDTDRDRAAILGLLDDAEVRALADTLELDLDRARAAVAALGGAELRDLAEKARQIETERVGGQRAISTTTIILVLLVLILVIVAVD